MSYNAIGICTLWPFFCNDIADALLCVEQILRGIHIGLAFTGILSRLYDSARCMTQAHLYKSQRKYL
ncbi:unnamed protein product [Allacma fusca]|uniref:Uncharacterized protein n=1 Tax=Allacma fusca TaxID=39272 RepID=A0A8J2JKI7_9HEXA|nr:unnamed protein product [Allacma fusca]